MMVDGSCDRLRFGPYELDVAAYELRRDGLSVRLERQPMDLLILLVEQRGRMVSRHEIVNRLWGKDVFVDVETGVHTAIRKIRQALRDSTDAPAFVETVPGKGYRFVAAVDIVRDAAPPSTAAASEPSPPVPSRRTASRRARLIIALVALAILASGATLAWRQTRPPESELMVAVLPFENLSGDPDRDYLADGLADETIASLGQIDPDNLAVIGRTSVMAYKGTTKSLAAIGKELGVDYLVEGSVQAERGQLRITSKLIRAKDQVQIWSAFYDREPTSMLGLQRELSTAIAEQIRLRLSPERLDALARRHTRNAEAYDLYLRGRKFANQRTPATTLRAIEYFGRATALDPNYALAWSGLADAYAASPLNGDADPLKVGPPAREAAAHAIRADINLAEAQLSLAYVNWIFSWDWPAAEAGFRRAVELDPGRAVSHWRLGHAMSQAGRHREAIPHMRRARELDPLNPMTHAMSSQVAFQARDYSAALEHARQAIVVDDEFWIGYVARGQAYEQLGKANLAFEALTNAARLSGNSKALSLRGYLLAKMGRTEDARDVLKTLEAAARDRYIPPYAMALVHAGLGEPDAAFESLDRAYSARDPHLIFLTVDPKWDAYRSDSRLQALLARCGFTRAANPGDSTR